MKILLVLFCTIVIQPFAANSLSFPATIIERHCFKKQAELDARLNEAIKLYNQNKHDSQLKSDHLRIIETLLNAGAIMNVRHPTKFSLARVDGYRNKLKPVASEWEKCALLSTMGTTLDDLYKESGDLEAILEKCFKGFSGDNNYWDNKPDLVQEVIAQLQKEPELLYLMPIGEYDLSELLDNKEEQSNDDQ